MYLLFWASFTLPEKSAQASLKTQCLKINQKCLISSFLKDQKLTFFHFAGNSLRLVHVFWRLPEKTSHPFFNQKWVFWPFSAKKAKKGQKAGKKKNFPFPGREKVLKRQGRKKIFPSRERKKIFPSREGKNFFLPCLFSTFALPGKENFFFFPAFWTKKNVLAFFGLFSPWNIH